MSSACTSKASETILTYARSWLICLHVIGRGAVYSTSAYKGNPTTYSLRRGIAAHASFFINKDVGYPIITILYFMRKVFLFLVAFLGFALCASAQLGEKTTFGLRAGMGLGGFSSPEAYRLIGGSADNNWNIDRNNKVTYNVGAIVDIPVYRKWGLSMQTGLWFTERHTKFEGTNSHNSSTWRDLDIKAMYLQLPLQIGYHYNFDIVNVQALFGPYMEYRVGKGKSHAQYSLKGTDVEGDAFSDSDNDFSCGLSFGLGAEYKHMYLGLKYDLGLTNYYSGSNNDRKEKQQLDLKGNMFSVVLGWNF